MTTITRRVAALAVTGLLALSGCTSGGDDVVAAGDTAEAEVIAALDAAQAGTGKISIHVEVDEAANAELIELMTSVFEPFETGEQPDGEETITEAWDDAEAWEDIDLDRRLTGEFSADDAQIAVEDDDTFTVRYVNGRIYESAALQLDPTGGLSGDLADDLGIDLPSDLPSGPELPEGIEWVETDPDDSFFVGFAVDFMDQSSGIHVLRSDQLHDIVEAGAGEVDGTSTRRYTATLDQEAVQAMIGPAGYTDDTATDDASPEDESGGDGESEGVFADPFERFEAIERYMYDHMSASVEIHLDERGQLVRVSVAPGIEVEPAYEECRYLRAMAAPVAVTVDYSGLGSDVQIVEPPAESVMSSAEYDELMSSSFDNWMAEEDGAVPNLRDLAPERVLPGDRSYGPDGELVKVQTSAGERYRADVEDDLVKFGSVIELDPATVADLDDAALVDAHDRAAAALAAMPRTATAMGEMTRVEMLWNVRWGMETFGLDPATADGMSDEDLAELIDNFVGDMGVSGDGVWGDGPMSYSDSYGDMGEWSEDEWLNTELDEDDLFGEVLEGCPT